MKNNKPQNPGPVPPTRHHLNVLGQLLKLIPRNLIDHAARTSGVAAQARTFSPYSHLVAMLFAQLVHALSLNDLADWLTLKIRALASLGASPPSRNNLSHANRIRSACFPEMILWGLLQHCYRCEPRFWGHRKQGPLRRFRTRIFAVDSTVLELTANSMDWARHRQRKAAAKMHLRLDLTNSLPGYAVIDAAHEHDNRRARELCAPLQAGEIVVFDKAYVDFEHLHDLHGREVHWVTRAKDNMQYRVKKRLKTATGGNIVKDEIIELSAPKWERVKISSLRRVEAWVEVDKEWKLMTFITNNLKWSAATVCALYKARWEIEVFFKQIKQTLKLSAFMGYSANAIRWQIWTALLLFILLRFAGYLGQWSHAFARLFAVVRSALWERLDLLGLLRSYGTAGGRIKLIGSPHTAWLPGMVPA